MEFFLYNEQFNSCRTFRTNSRTTHDTYAPGIYDRYWRRWRQDILIGDSQAYCIVGCEWRNKCACSDGITGYSFPVIQFSGRSVYLHNTLMWMLTTMVFVICLSATMSLKINTECCIIKIPAQMLFLFWSSAKWFSAKNEMIDVGDGASAVFWCWCRRKKDLIIGYKSVSVGGNVESGLAYFRNTGTLAHPAFEFVTRIMQELLRLQSAGLWSRHSEILTAIWMNDMLIGAEDDYAISTIAPDPDNLPTLYILLLLTWELMWKYGRSPVGWSQPRRKEGSCDRRKTDLLIIWKCRNGKFRILYDNTD